MKIPTLTALILALFVCHRMNAQVAVFVGATRWSESEINLQEHFLEPFDNSLRYAHSRKNIGISYQKNHHLVSFEVSHFRKRGLQNRTSISSVSGGGSSPMYHYSKMYYCQVDYGYLGTKLGYAYTFQSTSPLNKKWKTYIELGAFVGADFLSSYGERNHRIKEIASNNSNAQHQMTVTLDEEWNEEFKGVSMRKMPAFIGLYAARRLMIGPIFIRAAVSYGSLSRSQSNYIRITPLNSERKENGSVIDPEPERKRFFSTELTIGYTFKRKS